MLPETNHFFRLALVAHTQKSWQSWIFRVSFQLWVCNFIFIADNCHEKCMTAIIWVLSWKSRYYPQNQDLPNFKTKTFVGGKCCFFLVPKRKELMPVPIKHILVQNQYWISYLSSNWINSAVLGSAVLGFSQGPCTLTPRVLN